MKLTSFISLTILSGFALIQNNYALSEPKRIFVNNKAELESHLKLIDTIPLGKVIISNGEEGLEFSPLSSQNNGALIEPINRTTKKGVSTAFYLSDTSNWSFYTNSQQRLIIGGNNKITANSSLLINNKNSDTALRVNGKSWFDSTISLQESTNSSILISLNKKVRYSANEPDDGVSPYTSTPTSWANGKNIPVFRFKTP